MKHYEIVLIIHPDQSDQVSQMVEKYQKQITDQGGQIHRFEDWGRRMLAYPIHKIHKGHYILMNIECSNDTLDELNNAFKFNDAIIRSLVLKMKAAVSGESAMLKNPEEKEKYDPEGNRGSNYSRNETRSSSTESDETGSSESDPVESESVESESNQAVAEEV